MYQSNFLKNPARTSFASWIIFMTIISTGLLGVHHKASAVWGIGDLPVDTPNLGSNVSSAISEGGSLGSILADLAKEIGLDTLAYVMGQQIGEQLVNKFTTWATGGGFEDNPLFIQDQKSFMNEIKDIEILKLASDLDTAGNSGSSGYDFSNFSSSGSTGDVGGGNSGNFEGLSSSDQSVVTSIVDDEKKTLAEKLEPTMSADERSNFSQNFAMGGWDAWDKLGRPENNPIGREKIITDEYTKRLAESEEAAQREAEQNDGYMGQKECLEQRDNSIFGNYDFSSYGYQVNTGTTRQDADCAQQTTKTPGGVAAHTTEESSTFNFQSIASIDEISEVASNALGAMITGLINDGLSEIGSGTSTSQGTGLITSAGSNTTTTNSGGIDWLSTPKQLPNMRVELANAIGNTGIALAHLKATVESQERQFRIIQDLDYLLPGPDYGWQDRLKKHFDNAIIGTTSDVAQGDATDDDDVEQKQRLNELKIFFADSISAQIADMDNLETYGVFEPAKHLAIQDHISRLAKLGQENVRAKEDLANMRNLYGRLLAIKTDITRTVRPNDYLSLSHGVLNETTGEWDGATYPGVLNETTGEWDGATWLGLTKDEWKAWEESGMNEDGSTQTDPNGTPVPAVIARNKILNQFISVQQEVPVLNILSRIKNSQSNNEYNVEDMEKLLVYAEKFWADNYRLSSTGGEDLVYWRNLYGWFLQYLNPSLYGTGDAGIPDMSNLGNLLPPASGSGLTIMNTNPFLLTGQPLLNFLNAGGYRKVTATWNGEDEHYGPWAQGTDLSTIPNWPQNNPGFEPANTQQYINQGVGALTKQLRKAEGTNFIEFSLADFGKVRKVKAYSMAVTFTPHLGAWHNGYNGWLDPNTPSFAWNVLRRDREERLYCGFATWPRNKLSYAGDNYMRSYNGIFCSDGWYRAKSVDYNKAFRPDMAQLYSQL